MFDGRVVIVTPSEATRPAAVTEVSGFWQSLGANVMTMSPARHDAALAITSHLPHVAAVALAAATPTELLRLTASGWRDTTRIAAADPKLWQAIFAANRQHVLDAIDLLSQTLENFREALELGDHESLISMLEAAAKKKRERDALGD
jgi:prephenate dehydrogenase